MKKILKKAVVFMLVFSMAFSALTVFAAEATAELTVVGSNYTISIVEDNAIVKTSANQTLYNYSQRYPVGTVIELAATADNFGYWMNSGKVRQGSLIADGQYTRTYRFTLTGNTTVTAVYYNADADTAYVEWVSESGQVMQAGNYAATSEITEPNGPTKVGNDFNGWSLDATGIQNAIAGGSKRITVTPTYVAKETTFALEVYIDGTLDEAQSGDVEGYGYSAVTAPAIEGKTFDYWSDKDGNILSIDSTYEVLMTSKKSVYAVYVNAGEELKRDSGVTITGMRANVISGGYQLATEARMTIMDGYTLVERGFLRTKDEALATEEYMKTDNAGTNSSDPLYKRVSSGTSTNYTLNTNTTDPAQNFYLRGYMILQKGTETVTLYSDIWGYSYNSLSTLLADPDAVPGPLVFGTTEDGSMEDNGDVPGTEWTEPQ